MRLSHTAFIAATIGTFAVLLASPAAAASRLQPPCDDIFAKTATSWIDETTEVGEVGGLLNGAIYLRYSDKQPPAANLLTDSKPNLVITTKTGALYLWVSGKSALEPDGAITRGLRTIGAYGTGEFAKATIDLTIIGQYYPGKGGEYEVVGTICKPGIRSTRKPR